MSTKEITSLAKYQLDKMPEWTVKSISLDGSDAYNYTYSYGRSKAYVMVPYESSIKEAQQALSEILGGAVRESSYSKVSNINTPSSSTNSSSSSNNVQSSEPSIKLSSEDITVKVGEITTLSATVTNSTESVIWSSSDTSIASVHNGKITPIRTGTVTITAKIGNKTATCIVRINGNSDEQSPLRPILPSESTGTTEGSGESSENGSNTGSGSTESNIEDTQN